MGTNISIPIEITNEELKSILADDVLKVYYYNLKKHFNDTIFQIIIYEINIKITLLGENFTKFLLNIKQICIYIINLYNYNYIHHNTFRENTPWEFL